jgi:hypothetical protein
MALTDQIKIRKRWTAAMYQEALQKEGRKVMTLIAEVKVSELLKILRANRAKHRQVFEAALEGWRKQAVARVDQASADLKAGKFPSLFISLPLPEDHTRDYDRVIRLVSMHQGETIRLDEQHIAEYVEDDWGWKRQFLTTSSSYAAGATAAAYGTEADTEDKY